MCASRSYSKFEKRVVERTSGNVAESNSCCDNCSPDGSGSQYNIYVIQHKCPYCNNLVSPPLCSQHQPPTYPSYYGGNCYSYPPPYPSCPPHPYPYNQQVRCSVNCNPLSCEASAVTMKNKPNVRKKCCILPGLDESQAECSCCKAGKCPCCRTGKECGKSYDDKSIQSDQSLSGSSGSRRRSSVSSSVQTSTKDRGSNRISRRIESKERHQEIRSVSRGRSVEGELRRYE